MISALNTKLAVAQNRVTQAVTSSALWMRWQSLSSDGQRIVKWSIALLAVALVWAYVWLPAARGREALSLRIPVLQAQLATMRNEAAEVKRINTMPLVITINPRTLADSVGLQTVFGQNNTAAVTVTINERRQFRVNIASVAYTSWLDSLDMALSHYRVRVVSVNLKPLQPGSSAALMAVELVLADDAPAGR